MENSKTYESIGRTLYPLFFNRNFGLTTKSEIESLLFNIYLKEKKSNSEDFSYRFLSRELGISEAKVKNLKRTCFARYEDEIKFPELLITLSEENSDLMFFNIVNKTDEMKCQITITEVVYYDELRVQLTNSKIQFDKNIGSNYVELLMADTIRFFDQNPIQNENDDLENLISELKEADFKQSKKDVIEGMVKDSPFSNTILAVLQLTKKY